MAGIERPDAGPLAAAAATPGGPGPLWLALGVQRGDVVAFTGGGGKTSLCRVLVNELRQRGWRVVYATTAKMSPAPGMPLVLRDEAGAGWLDAVTAHLSAGDREGGAAVCVGAALREDGRLVSLDPGDIEALVARADAVIVEADGSAGRSLKAPAAHEPAIPPCATLVCPVAGMDGAGQPLDDRCVKRPELFAALTGLGMGATIRPEHVAAVMSHPAGIARGAPPGSRIVHVLNKLDVPGAPGAAAAVAAALLKAGTRRVVATAAGAALTGRVDRPALAATGAVLGAVLAAGAGSRFANSGGSGGGKLLRPLGVRPVAWHAASTATRAGLAGVAVVVGPRDGAALREALAAEPLWCLDNAEAEAGIATSVAAATRFALGWSPHPLPPPRALMFLLGDQPLLDPQVPDRLVAEFLASSAPAVAARAGGQVVSPNLFERALWPELLSLEGDVGGRQVLRRHSDVVRWVDFPDAGPFLDIDVASDLERARARLSQTSRHRGG